MIRLNRNLFHKLDFLRGFFGNAFRSNHTEYCIELSHLFDNGAKKYDFFNAVMRSKLHNFYLQLQTTNKRTKVNGDWLIDGKKYDVMRNGPLIKPPTLLHTQT